VRTALADLRFGNLKKIDLHNLGVKIPAKLSSEVQFSF